MGRERVISLVPGDNADFGTQLGPELLYITDLSAVMPSSVLFELVSCTRDTTTRTLFIYSLAIWSCIFTVFGDSLITKKGPSATGANFCCPFFVVEYSSRRTNINPPMDGCFVIGLT